MFEIKILEILKYWLMIKRVSCKWIYNEKNISYFV